MSEESRHARTRGTCITLHLERRRTRNSSKSYTVRSVLDKVLRLHARADLPERGSAPEDKKDESAEDDAEDKPEAQSEEKPEQINDVNPLWLQASPADCTDEEYKRVLSQGVPRLRGTAVLDPSERGIPVQPEGHPVLPEDQERVLRQRGSWSSSTAIRSLWRTTSRRVIPEFLLLLKGVDGLPGSAAERVALLPAERRLRARSCSGYITRKVADRLLTEFNNETRGLSELLGRHPSVRQVRLHAATRSSTTA